MATQGAFKHTSKYAATATKYGTREGEDGDGDPSSKKEPGVWDGFKADERAPRSRKNARLGDREKLLDKDYGGDAPTKGAEQLHHDAGACPGSARDRVRAVDRVRHERNANERRPRSKAPKREISRLSRTPH